MVSHVRDGSWFHDDMANGDDDDDYVETSQSFNKLMHVAVPSFMNITFGLGCNWILYSVYTFYNGHMLRIQCTIYHK